MGVQKHRLKSARQEGPIASQVPSGYEHDLTAGMTPASMATFTLHGCRPAVRAHSFGKLNIAVETSFASISSSPGEKTELAFVAHSLSPR